MLKEKLMADLKEAMKEKQVLRKNVVQMIRAAILQVEKDKQIELEDNQILEIIAKEVDGIYIPYTKVKKGKYVYSVSANNKNYAIESVGNLNKVPLPNTIISKEYEF